MKRFLAFLVLLLPLSACGDVARLVSSGDGAPAPAQVAFSATVNSNAQQEATLRVEAYYLKENGDRVAIGIISRPLTDASKQTVPLPIDLATCIADPQHMGAGTSDANSCSVLLDVQLIVGSSVVDKQLVGPLKLTPGSMASVSEGVTLSVIQSVVVHIGDGPALPPNASTEVLVGNTLSLRAVILDDQQREVTNRQAEWLSTSPDVASVSASGVVTALSVGTTTIRATVGEVSSQVVVNVKPNTATLSVEALQGVGQGSVVSIPAGIDCQISGTSTSGICAFGFPIGTTVTLVSNASSGNRFVSWGDACNGTTAECQLTISGAQTVGASFTALRHIAIVAQGDGSGSVTGSGVNCTVILGVAAGDCAIEVAEGTSVTLNAAALSGGEGVSHIFDGWGGVCGSSGATCVFTANGGDIEVPVHLFAPKPLNVQLAGNGSGTVVSQAGISCSISDGAQSGACSMTLMHGTQVTLVATPATYSKFAGWSGACANEGSAQCTTDMTSARTVSASFTRDKVKLTLEMLGGGEGTLRVNGEEQCHVTLGAASNICDVEYDEGSELTVTAVAGSHSSFNGFEASCNGNQPCTFTLEEPRTVRARFAADLVTLRVDATSGSGTGRIVGVEGVTFDCLLTSNQGAQGDCVDQVPFGTTVVIRAVPNANNALTDWGGVCSSSNSMKCEFTVGTTQDISASFSPAINVRMNLSGNGAGRVEFHFPGIPLQDPCITDGTSNVVCTFARPVGVGGIFHAMPSLGSTFSGFTGPCSNLGNPPWPTCEYRGIGFSIDIFGTFSK